MHFILGLGHNNATDSCLSYKQKRSATIYSLFQFLLQKAYIKINKNIQI